MDQKVESVNELAELKADSNLKEADAKNHFKKSNLKKISEIYDADVMLNFLMKKILK